MQNIKSLAKTTLIALAAYGFVYIMLVAAGYSN